MPSRIRTADAAAALRKILEEKVDQARGNNTLVSKTEAKSLDPFLQRADAELREDGGPGTRVKRDELIDRAADTARAAWEQFQTSPRDSLTLSKAELRDIQALDPALGNLTTLALLRLGGGAQDPTAAVKALLEGVDFTARPLELPGFTRLDARVGQPDRAGLPAAVGEAFDFFYRVEDRDIGSTRLHRGTVGGEPVYALVTTTDGDDAYLEVRKGDGALLAGARVQADKVLAWDEFPERVRLSNLFTATFGDVTFEDGMSEPAERAAAGQPPVQWRGQAELTSGSVHHKDAYHFLGVDLPAGIPDGLRDVAVAAFDHLWPRLSPRLSGADARFELGPGRDGQMFVGEFTRPTDGKTYLVASWRDIDDESFVLYFARGAKGLELVTTQYDN